MVTISTESAATFSDSGTLDNEHSRSEESLRSLKDGTGPGAEWRGWMDLLDRPDDALIEKLDRTARQVRDEADVFIVCGIGGSYLGARAVIDALVPPFSESSPEIIYAGHHISGVYHEQLINYLNTPKPDGRPKSVYVNVISKSGSTTEPAIAFRLLRDWMHKTYGDDASRRIICTTGETGGALNKVIDAYGYPKFIIPDDVGGRFSVLTPVGLLPIAVAGVDIQSLFYGAVDAYNDTNKEPSEILNYAAVRHALYKKGYYIDALATMEPALSSFGGWIQQLYGESEGKGGEGIFPTVLNYTTDLHSLGQMMQDGRRIMMETFLTVKQPLSNLSVEREPEDFDGLNYLAGKTLHEINRQAFLGTHEAHEKGQVPIFTIELNQLNEVAVGRMIYLLELATAVFVYNLSQNPFDQPGVEDYKKAMFKLLGKP